MRPPARLRGARVEKPAGPPPRPPAPLRVGSDEKTPTLPPVPSPGGLGMSAGSDPPNLIGISGSERKSVHSRTMGRTERRPRPRWPRAAHLPAGRCNCHVHCHSGSRAASLIPRPGRARRRDRSRGSAQNRCRCDRVASGQLLVGISPLGVIHAPREDRTLRRRIARISHDWRRPSATWRAWKKGRQGRSPTVPPDGGVRNSQRVSGQPSASVSRRFMAATAYSFSATSRSASRCTLESSQPGCDCRTMLDASWNASERR